MSRFSILGWLTAAARQPRRSPRKRRPVPGPRPTRWVPQLEVLEDRFVPSTLTVTSAADDGSSGTLRALLSTASPGSTIVFAHALRDHMITLTQGQLTLTKSLDI